MSCKKEISFSAGNTCGEPGGDRSKRLMKVDLPAWDAPYSPMRGRCLACAQLSRSHFKE